MIFQVIFKVRIEGLPYARIGRVFSLWSLAIYIKNRQMCSWAKFKTCIIYNHQLNTVSQSLWNNDQIKLGGKTV